MSITELRKGQTLKRRIGGLVIEVSEKGVRLRGAGNSLAVSLTYPELAKCGLIKQRLNLSEQEWERPLESLRKLNRLKWK